MSVESHTANIFAKEPLRLPEPVHRAAIEFAGLVEEICVSELAQSLKCFGYRIKKTN